MHIKLSKIKRGVRHSISMKTVRKKLGLTGSSRHIRQLKRRLKGGAEPVSVEAYQPTSASSYQHNSRTLSQLTGGV